MFALENFPPLVRFPFLSQCCGGRNSDNSEGNVTPGRVRQVQSEGHSESETSLGGRWFVSVTNLTVRAGSPSPSEQTLPSLWFGETAHFCRTLSTARELTS